MSGSASRTRLAYLDSSAILKLAVLEPESDALRAALSDWPERVASALARVEVVRAVRRAAPAAEERAREVLARVGLIPVSGEVLQAAEAILPAGVRTLAALHVATALSLGDDCGGVFAYDRRLLEAARAAGLTAFSPG